VRKKKNSTISHDPMLRVSSAGLLSSNYTSTEVYARSTSFERAVSHAQSVLLGLFPPGTGPASLPLSFQPVPVHAPPDTDDVMLRAGDKCQALADAVGLLYASDRWRAKEEESAALLGRVSALLGANVTLRAVPLYGEVVAALRNQGLLGAVMGNATAAAFLGLYDWVQSTKLAGKQAGRVVAGILLGQIVSDMKLRVAQRRDAGPVFNLFSVHAENVMALYSALGIDMATVPAPGFELTFELHGNVTAWPNTVGAPLVSRSPEDFFVIVRAGGTPIAVPGCGTAARPECRFDLFDTAVSYVTQTYPEWEKDCKRLAPPPSSGGGSNSTSCDDGGVHFSQSDFAFISVGVAIGGTLLGVAIGYICHKRSTIRVQKKYLKLVESGVLSY
jgi:hypothetical protein